MGYIVSLVTIIQQNKYSIMLLTDHFIKYIIIKETNILSRTIFEQKSGKRSYMGAKDTKAKEFLSNNERFADVFNYYMFDGKSVIKPEDLQEKDTTEVISLYGIDGKEMQKQKWRDLLKSAIIKKTEGIIYVLLGAENQSDIHYAMPVKNMIYDAMNYGSQVAEAARSHKDKKDFDSSAEFLAGFKRDDKLTPVITLTVYWGAEAWDAPRCLHDMFPDMDSQILRYVDNYHLHLIVPQEIMNFERFQTSLGEVFEVIKASDDKKKMKSIFASNPKFKSLENEAVSAINVFTGLNIPIDKKEGKTDMCKAWQDQWLDGKAEGREEGIEALILDNLEDGKTEEVIINKLIRRFGLKPEEAQNYYDKYAKESSEIQLIP